MAVFRSLENITLSMLDFLRIVQPDLDTKPGSVARDIMVDAPAQELAKLYIELRNVANLQAIATATGLDLDNLARNFGITRGSGSRATGVVVFTTNTLDSDILISAGSTVTAINGFTFSTQSDSAFSVANANVYKANAIRMRTDLDLAGISDPYALEVAVESTNPGVGGNIGKFSIVTHSIAGISDVTNLQPFTGGASTETDSVFRARVLGVFAGSNTGTDLGYKNALLVDPAIVDVLDVGPGDTLMTRDGTQVVTNSNGVETIVAPGTGGKVDLYVQGSNLQTFAESFIYRDQSGRNDPTDPNNDFVFGQRGLSTLLDFQQRRRQSIQSGLLPFQPVDDVISVSGSISGPNFIAKFTDTDGQVKGSYELVKDTGAFGGSPFGFDKIHFISGTIELDKEVATKGVFNGQDPLDFTSIESIISVEQDTVVNNENPLLSTVDRSSLTFIHTPISSVERVVNLTTGERYVISDQNPDGEAGGINNTGRILIAGNTLPTATDTLQANYIWNLEFDENLDYDNLSKPNVFRTVQDSIDWGFANRILAEEQTVLFSVADGYHVLLDLPASKVINVNTRLSETVTNVSGKLTVSTKILNIVSIVSASGAEVFNTSASDGAFSSFEITLPTDTLLENGQNATVIYNAVDLFSPDGYDNGSINDNIVTLPTGVASAGQAVFVDYIANVNSLLGTTALSALPVVGNKNSILVGGIAAGKQPVFNIYNGSSISANAKFAPSYLILNVDGIQSKGRFAVNGTSFIRIDDIITIVENGLTIDLATSIKNALGLSVIPATGFVSYVAKAERITLSAGNVSSVDYGFDVLNYNLKNRSYSNGTALTDTSLSTTQIRLSATEDNVVNNPTTGEKIRITYYYSDSNQTENIVVTAIGQRITKYRYVFINSVSVSSGFTNLAGNITGTLSITNFTQPISATNYNVAYEYTAPKEGERITVQYNYNKLIGDATLRIEDVRPITADVLIKAAVARPVDATVFIVATSDFNGTDATLESNVQETISIFLTARGLNTTLDSSDVINATYSVSGIDRARITLFNFSGLSGIEKSLVAGRDEFLVAGTVKVFSETR